MLKKKPPKSCSHNEKPEAAKWFLHWQIHKLPWNFDYSRARCLFHLQDFYNISMSKYTLITEYFNITVHKFQQWERPLRANLETQLWLPGLVRFIKIYETANIWISGVLVFFQHLDSQTDRRSAWICSWRGSTSTFPESHPIFCEKKRLWCEPWAYLPLFSSCVRPLQRSSLLFIFNIWREAKTSNK